MTITEFLLLHTATQGTNINFSQRVNVLFNPVGGDDEGIIEAITVTAQALSFNDSSDQESTNITSILEQVEEISFTFDGVTYTLEVIESAFYPGNNAFFYFRVSSNFLIPNIFDADILNTQPTPDIIFNFHPFLSPVTFIISDSNVLYNLADNLRKSSEKLESDRIAGQIIPSNFSAILTTSASKAEVQDSFYTDTGLTNARYAGSKSTPSNQGGISPSLSARQFTGVVHPDTATNDVACGILGSDAEITRNLLHTGPTLLPTFASSSAFIETAENFLINNISLFYNYTGADTGQGVPNIDVGDVITPSGSTELMRVLEHNTFNKKLIVQRNYFSGSNPAIGGSGTLDSGTGFDIIRRTDVLTIDEFEASLQTVGSSKVFVTNGNLVIHTDEFGAIYSQSFCPPPLLLGIDDDNPAG